jgi:hypothetical protein
LIDVLEEFGILLKIYLVPASFRDAFGNDIQRTGISQRFQQVLAEFRGEISDAPVGRGAAALPCRVLRSIVGHARVIDFDRTGNTPRSVL